MDRLRVDNIQVNDKRVVFVRWSMSNVDIKVNSYVPTAASSNRLSDLTFRAVFAGSVIWGSGNFTSILKRPIGYK